MHHVAGTKRVVHRSTALAAAATLVCSGLLGTVVAAPAVAADNGRIAFLGGADADEIFLVDPDGSDRVAVPTADSGLGDGENPDINSVDIARDGTKVVYHRNDLGEVSASEDEGPSDDIYLSNVDGTGLAQLTDTNEYTAGPAENEITIGPDEADPTFSPSAATIAFTYLKQVNDTVTPELRTMSTGGGIQTTISAGLGSYSDPAFAPDGTTVLFSATSSPGSLENRDLYSVHVADRTAVKLTNTPDIDESSPSASPDGTRIVFRSSGSNGDIVVMNADGSGPTPLVTGDASDNAPVFSPDGRKVAFDRDAVVGDAAKIFVVDVAGGAAPVRLSTDSTADFAESAPSWSGGAAIPNLPPKPPAPTIPPGAPAPPPGYNVIVLPPGGGKVKGTSRSDAIYGRGGNDTIDGGGGNDRIIGGGGNDRIIGAGGNDRISGGSGRDRLDGGSGNDRLRGNGGKDRLEGGKGRDNLKGGPDKDRINGGPGRDTARQ